MSSLYLPPGYSAKLNQYQTQSAIGLLKRIFEDNLSAALRLRRVSAPLFVEPCSGLNDDLNGVERPVEFDVPETGGNAQVVHSLAKWKRLALCRYGFQPGEGLYTDMNAIRRDEELDNLHSVYVDQWDWEMVLDPSERHFGTLKSTVEKIVCAICDTHATIMKVFPSITTELCREVSFISSQELEDMYPALSPKARENTYAQEHGTVFISQIGGVLKSGYRHDGRAPDYDDWTLNGDILLWNELLGRAIEISSMGIRVDSAALDRQLSLSGCDDRRALPFHRMLLEGALPQTIGGGIGQSRLSMIILGKAHIGEVQVSVWDEETRAGCQAAGIMLL